MKRFASEELNAPTLFRIDRIYTPENEALDALVDVLHALLVDDAGPSETSQSAAPEQTCFSPPPE